MTSETLIAREILAQLLEAGVPLGDVASLAGLPAAPGKLPMDASAMVQAVVEGSQTDDPASGLSAGALSKLKLWSDAVKHARTTGPDFTDWVAEHVLQMNGAPEEVESQLQDIKGWVQASVTVQLPPHVCEILFPHLDGSPAPYDRFVKQPFHPSMPVETVISLSGDWHEAIAKHMQTEYCGFPRPWLAPFTINNYSFVPITNCADLYREGHSIRRHGVFHRSELVDQGHTYYYSTWKKQKRIATLELIRKGDTIELGEIVGFCDPETNLQIKAAVESWLNCSSHRFPPTQKQECQDEIPF